jgi:mRNA-degrading endonuclease RelE of RelBE toxin-antitoxin system
MTSSHTAVVLSPEARADLGRLRSLLPRFIKQFRTLETRPERGHPLRGALVSCRSLVLSRVGGGYRAVYIYDREHNECYIFAIGEHATVYGLAQQRFQPRRSADTEPND